MVEINQPQLIGVRASELGLVTISSPSSEGFVAGESERALTETRNTRSKDQASGSGGVQSNACGADGVAARGRAGGGRP